MAAKTKVDRTKFIELAAEGKSNKELQEHFKVSECTISRLRKTTGTSTKPTMTPERKARIEAMIADGWSFAEITRTEGADPETLRRHFPGQAWTERERCAYLSTLRMVNPYFNKHPGRRLAA